MWLGGVAPSYAAAEAILRRIGHANISSASIWRRVQDWGGKFKALAEAECAQANALPAQWAPPSRAEVRDQRMGAAMDGTMINIHKEGWKELKVGTVFEIAVWPTKDDQTGELVDLAHAVHNSYVAHLGGPEVLGEMVWAKRGAEAGDKLRIRRSSGMAPSGSGIKPRSTSRTVTKLWIGITAPNIWRWRLTP